MARGPPYKAVQKILSFPHALKKRLIRETNMTFRTPLELSQRGELSRQTLAELLLHTATQRTSQLRVCERGGRALLHTAWARDHSPAGSQLQHCAAPARPHRAFSELSEPNGLARLSPGAQHGP